MSSEPPRVLLWKGTLYSVDPRTRDRGSGTQGPETHGPDWHTLYTYIHSTWVSNRSTGMHYGMDCEILCAVDGTFILAAFVPSHSVRHQKRPFLL